jgi:hypothetical protein
MFLLTSYWPLQANQDILYPSFFENNQNAFNGIIIMALK